MGLLAVAVMLWVLFGLLPSLGTVAYAIIWGVILGGVLLAGVLGRG